MDRILIDTAAVLSATFYLDGVATDPSPATCTVTVTSDDGTVIDTDASTTHNGTGTFEYVLDALAEPDLLRLEWTATFSGTPQTIRTTAEIVGGYYASIAEIRDGDPSLASLTDYPWSAIDAARAEAEDEAERIMGRSFVSRYRRDRNLRVGDDGCIRTRMAHVTALRAISATSFGDAATISHTDCRIVGDDVVWTGLPCGSLVSLGYVHGGIQDPPYELVQKGILVRARQIAQRPSQAVPSSTDSYQMTDHGVIKLSQPTATSTGVAIADSVYRRHSLSYGIA